MTAGDELKLALWLARRQALTDRAHRADPSDLAGIAAKITQADQVIAALTQAIGRPLDIRPSVGPTTGDE